MLAGWELALGLAAMFFGAIVLGTISFGLGTVAMPFMLLILPPQDAVVIVNAVVVLTTGLTIVQTWRHLNLRETWPFVVAGLPPVPIGVLLVHEADPVALRLTIVVVILVLGVMSLFQIRLPGARSSWTAPVCGFIATLLVTTLGVGAPLAGLYSIAAGLAPRYHPRHAGPVLLPGLCIGVGPVRRHRPDRRLRRPKISGCSVWRY